MNDPYNENDLSRTEGTTRHRRTDRYKEPEAAAPITVPKPQEEASVPMGETRQQPSVSRQLPSQGVPVPTALRKDTPMRTQHADGSAPQVRRPVPAPDFRPVEQLGSGRPQRPTMEAPRRPQRMEPPMDDDEDEEAPRSGGLIAVILILLVIAAMIIGLIMIPEDAQGPLGDVKRAVTEPIKALIAGKDAEDQPKTEFSGFTATVVQDTAPYRVMFSLITTNNVTDVRVVDVSTGAVLPTVTTMNNPSTETTNIWMFEMTLQSGFEGKVAASALTGDKWVDTGLMQTLSIGMNTPPTISSVPSSAVTTAASATEKPTEEPTGTPTQQPTQEPTEQPTQTPTVPPVTDAPVTDAPVTDAPVVLAKQEETATPTIAVTATPTLSVTATPTLVPTATPSPSEAPTEEPTPEATAEPTAEPTPDATPEAAKSTAPVVTPKLEAAADESADPALITSETVWNGTKRTENYHREVPLNMPAADNYLPNAFGVTTFRGSAFRQNAACGTVSDPQTMSLLWTVEAGIAKGESRNYYGVGWTGQPLINKWSVDVRQILNVNEDLKPSVLKEVIVAGYDGRIYFLNLVDGSATREAINLGYPMRSTPTLHPMGFPMMTVGQYARKMKSGTSKKIGLYYYDLTDQKSVRLIDGLDKSLERTNEAAGAFDTSALIDRSTNTLIAIGTNGLLYTEALSMKIDASVKPAEFRFSDPEQVVLRAKAKGQSNAESAVESSLAMYGSYAYYADMEGILHCVDTTTMTTVWAVDTGDAVRAAVALDLDEETHTLWLYTANTVYNNRTRGNVTIRRYNAMTGKQDWAYELHCAEGKKKDVTFNKIIVPGAMASPVIGQHDLSGLVYFTLSSVSATGAESLGGNAAMEAVLLALDKESGNVVWHREMDAYCYASPVAVYNEDGRGWVIQACSNGMLMLLDGLTGETVSTLQLNGVIEGSPAVYYDTLVIGTTGKDKSYIYGISLK